jgi:hypothetical protein
MRFFATRDARFSSAMRRHGAVVAVRRPTILSQSSRLIANRLRAVRWLALAAALPVAIGFSQRPVMGQLILKKRTPPTVAVITQRTIRETCRKATRATRTRISAPSRARIPDRTPEKR